MNYIRIYLCYQLIIRSFCGIKANAKPGEKENAVIIPNSWNSTNQLLKIIPTK